MTAKLIDFPKTTQNITPEEVKKNINWSQFDEVIVIGYTLEDNDETEVFSLYTSNMSPEFNLNLTEQAMWAQYTVLHSDKEEYDA